MEAGSPERGKPSPQWRILQVHNFYRQAGGEDVVFRAEGKLLRDAGHAVDDYTVSNDDIGSHWQALKAAASITWSRAHYTALRQKIRAFRPDVVHVHNFFPLITPSVFDACKDEGVPVVLTLHNYRLVCVGSGLLFRDGKVCEDCIGGSPFQAVMHGCYKDSRLASLAIARMIDHHRRARTWQTKVDRFIALTDFQRRKMIEAGLPAEKIVVKPNFIDDPLPPGARIDGPRHGVLYVGRLSREKGVDLLVDAWHDIDHPLIIVGTGEQEAMLRARAPGTVTFLGHQPHEEIIKLMLAANFLIMPSAWYEAFGMTVLEAHACGLPVVSSNLGSLSALATVGDVGWTFDSGNRADLVATVQRALAEPPTSIEARTRLRQRYLAHYSTRNALERLLACYSLHADSSTRP